MQPEFLVCEKSCMLLLYSSLKVTYAFMVVSDVGETLLSFHPLKWLERKIS